VKGLFDRYPGSKRNYLLLDGDGSDYDCIIEPFIGAGWQTLKALRLGIKQAFIADADPSVWAVWECWRGGFSGAVEERVKEWQFRFMGGANAAWSELKREFEHFSKWVLTDPHYESNVPLAAASLALRKLTFAGVTRCNKQGGLNVVPSKEQLEIFPRWRYAMPPKPQGTVSLSWDWADAIAAFESSDCQQAIAIVDSPYWLPYTPGTKRRGTGWMTAAYVAHNPHADAEFSMCVDAVRRLAHNPRVKCLKVCNYDSEPMQQALEAIASEAGHPITRELVGKLDGLNASRASTTQNQEVVWTIGVGAVQQLRLMA
jgi:hypothetical protein